MPRKVDRALYVNFCVFRGYLLLFPPIDLNDFQNTLLTGAIIELSDNDGWRPLHAALRSTEISDADRLATVAVLLKNGADPNAINVGGYERDGDHDRHVGYRTTLPNVGNTPVAIAKSNGFTEIVIELTTNGGT